MSCGELNDEEVKRAKKAETREVGVIRSLAGRGALQVRFGREFRIGRAVGVTLCVLRLERRGEYGS